MELELIIKYIEGTTTKEENKVLENWLISDVKNEIYLTKIKEILSSSKDYKEFRKLDVDKDWDLVERRMNNFNENKNAHLSTSIIYKRILQFAAIFVLALVFSGIFFYLNEKTKNNDFPVGYNEIYVPNGQKSEITLADGTKVWINAGSHLKLPNKFGETTRNIWLEGEAFFEVAKDKEKPFFVHTSDVNIKVLGTSFNVRAYSDEDLIETTLIEGAISLQKTNHNGEPDNVTVELEPNHKAVYFKSKNAYVTESLIKTIKQPLEIRKILISELIDANTASSWKEDKLIFDNEKFINIISQLERYYGVKIKVEDESLKNVRYTGAIKKISIEQTIKALQITTPFNYEINDNLILITTKNEANER